MVQRISIIDQAVGVGAALIPRKIPPPIDVTRCLYADRGKISEPMGLSVAPNRFSTRQCVISVCVQCQFFGATDRPAVFPTPVAWHLIDNARRMPLANINCEPGFIHNACIIALQPMIEPANGLVAPFHSRLWIGPVRPGVRPGTHHALDWSLKFFEHSRHAVAIAVIPSTDDKRRDSDAGVIGIERRPIPERTVMLLTFVYE